MKTVSQFAFVSRPHGGTLPYVLNGTSQSEPLTVLTGQMYAFWLTVSAVLLIVTGPLGAVTLTSRMAFPSAFSVVALPVTAFRALTRISAFT